MGTDLVNACESVTAFENSYTRFAVDERQEEAEVPRKIKESIAEFFQQFRCRSSANLRGEHFYQTPLFFSVQAKSFFIIISGFCL